MAKTKKGLTTEVAKLKARLSKIKERAASKGKRTRQVYSQATWKGAAPKPLGVYYIRIMVDATEKGSFGPYATVRAAAADAKNILRLNIGPGHKIVETGPVVPVIRSDKRIKLYLHPESYSAQVAGKGVVSAQVIEVAGADERLKAGPDDLGTFGVNYNPRRRTHTSSPSVTFEFPSRAAAHAAVRMFDAAGVQAGMPSLGGRWSGGKWVEEPYTVKVRASDAVLARTVLASAKPNSRRRRSNPLVSFKTRSGKTISFDAKHRNPAYEGGLDESKKVVVEGVKGMKSTPFRKEFRNFAAYMKWADSDAAANCTVYRVSNA